MNTGYFELCQVSKATNDPSKQNANKDSSKKIMDSKLATGAKKKKKRKSKVCFNQPSLW